MRRKTDKLFREEAVKLALSSPQSYAKTARDLGIHQVTLYSWINQHRSEHPQEAVGESQVDVIEENRRLKMEILRLKEERDILKKAAKFFANELK